MAEREIHESTLLKTFEEETRALCLNRVRISCLLSILFFLLFGVVDYLQEPAHLRLFLTLRVLEALLIGSILLLIDFKKRVNPYWAGWALFGSLGLVLSWMARMATSYPAFYGQGLFLILLGMSLLMPWRPRNTLVAAGTILLSYAVFNFSAEEPRRTFFINNLFWLGTVVGIALVTTYVNFRLRWKEFLARFELSAVNLNLEKALRDLQETEMQLVQSSKMAALGLLVAGVAHEINNPVSSAKSNSSIVRRFLDEVYTILKGQGLDLNHAGIKELTNKINTATSIVKVMLERIEGIVNDLKTFARKDELHFKLADPHEGLNATLNLLNYELRNRIEVVKEYGPIGLVEMIPGQINQVFMNLLQNAIDAIPGDQGEIRIKTWRELERVKISISDNGEGISHENLSRIFEPFFTTKEVGKGLGLGLSVSYRIVTNHGGEIGVQSRPKKGTEVQVTLPVRQPEKRKQLKERKPHQGPEAGDVL